MQTVCVGEHESPSEINMLPIIDLNPSDGTCVYSTLAFVSDQTRKMCLPTPCVTFDQPLYIKAVDVVAASVLDVVCRLGRFHTIMSI